MPAGRTKGLADDLLRTHLARKRTAIHLIELSFAVQPELRQLRGLRLAKNGQRCVLPLEGTCLAMSHECQGTHGSAIQYTTSG